MAVVMWSPAPFRQDDVPTMHALIEQHSFGLLVSQGTEHPQGTHLPFLLDRAQGPLGTLYAHMARGNPHARALTGTALVAFQGPHAYVSPAWYARPSVPTWNYVVVHAYGDVTLIEEPDQLRPLVERLTRLHEGVATAPYLEPPSARLLAGIVGLAIPIRKIEGQFNLSQNRSDADRRGVAAALAQSTNAIERSVASLMTRTPEGSRGGSPR